MHHDLFAGELGHPKTSLLLLFCSGCLALLLVAQIGMVTFSLQWIPFAALMMGTFASLVSKLSRVEWSGVRESSAATL